MLAKDIRRKYIDFFVRKFGHTEVGGAPLIPENDPTVLFTTAGMHPLVPYLMGEKHPLGKRLVSCQKCLRTDDIDEVGDDTHLTFFEMMGNWSLGDYFKEEAIQMSIEFLIDELGFDINKIFVTVFQGDDDSSMDDDAIKYWENEFKKRGIEAKLGERIFVYGKKENWWGPAGQTGPCGPDTEIFFDTGKKHDSKFGEKCHPNCDCGRFVEIWNNVFMQYDKTEKGGYSPLVQQNVDTGLGVERVTAILQGQATHYETELFANIISKIRDLSSSSALISERIIADHVRAATFLLADKITPSNVDQGYVLRRLIRRSVRHGYKIGINGSFLRELSEIIIVDYGDYYSELKRNKDFILFELDKEETQFSKTLKHGEKEFFKLLPHIEKTKDRVMSGRIAFKLYDTYGFPIEMTQELASEHNVIVDLEGYEKSFEKHQTLSRQGAAQKFKGGLADHSEMTTGLHTATHLLHQALRDVLGNHIEQRGSNITSERLRFDFSHSEKMTSDQIAQVENIVNQKIKLDLPVSFNEVTVEEAKKQGAIGLFEHKYGNKVKMYSIGDYSKEICGGPHIEHLGILKSFKIKKEQSSSSGVRRIKAIITI